MKSNQYIQTALLCLIAANLETHVIARIVISIAAFGYIALSAIEMAKESKE
jgi:predicted MFS family arabinose efflux permease